MMAKPSSKGTWSEDQSSEETSRKERSPLLIWASRISRWAGPQPCVSKRMWPVSWRKMVPSKSGVGGG